MPLRCVVFVSSKFSLICFFPQFLVLFFPYLFLKVANQIKTNGHFKLAHFRLWRKGSYCAFCNGCFGVRKEQGSLIVCKGCSRRAHAGKLSRMKQMPTVTIIIISYFLYLDCLAQIKKKEYLCTACTDKAKYKK